MAGSQTSPDPAKGARPIEGLVVLARMMAAARRRQNAGCNTASASAQHIAERLATCLQADDPGGAGGRD